MNSCWIENLIIFTMALVLTRSTHSDSRVKLRFLSLLGVNSKSNLVKVAKNLRGARVWYKTMKNFILWGFWPSVNLGLTRGILVILVEKCTLGAPVSEWVAPRHSGCSRSPMEIKWHFWIFRSPTQIEGEQNTISTNMKLDTIEKFCFQFFFS